MQLDSRIKKAGELAKEAFVYLNKLQKGDKQLLKTGNDFIDCHIQGLLPSDVLLLGANSGIGKTKLLFDTLDQMLDTKVNPSAKNYKTLEFALEMKFLNRVLRDANKLTKKAKSKILIEEFTEEEQNIIRDYYDSLQDDRRYICEEPVTTKDFYDMTRVFCQQSVTSDSVIVAIDHVLLLQKENVNQDPLEALSGYINLLRKEFNNVYFILLSQMNRGSLVNIKDRDNSMIPTTAMIYGSSHFEFLSSYIVVLVDPFKLGVNEYLSVNEDRYDWLKEYMTETDNKGKVSFNTMGNMFVFVLKTRESDTPYKNLFIKKMDLTDDQLLKMKQSIEVKEPFKTASIDIPVFGKMVFETNTDVKPVVNFENVSDAFDAPIVEKNKPENEVPF